MYKITYLVFFIIFIAPSELLSYYTEWQLESLTDNSFTVAFHTKTGPDVTPCTFAFSTQPGITFTSSIHFDSTFSDLSTSQVHPSQSGTFGNQFIQWLTFKPPKNKEVKTSTGNLQVTFDYPIFAGLSMRSANLEHGILTIAVKTNHLSKSSLLMPEQVPFFRDVRIEITEEGIYKIYGKELQAIGVPISSIPVKTYQMYERDREVPLLFSESSGQTLNDNDYFLFYASQLRGTQSHFEQFSNTNVYRLFWGTIPGVRVATVSGDRRKDPNDYSTGISIKAQEFRDTLHIEYDNDIRWLGNIEDLPPAEITTLPDIKDMVDNWYWGIIGDNNITTFTFNLPSPALTGPAQMSIGLMGLTSIDSIQTDHKFKIFLNNNPAGSNSIAHWDGQREFVFKSDTFPSNSLVPGKNSISFLTENTSVPDRCALNWVEITYTRNYNVANDYLQFKSSPNAPGNVTEYELSGFSTPDIELWDINRNRTFTNFIIKEGNGKGRNSFKLIFQDSITYPVSYYTHLINNRKTPSLMALDTISRGWDTLISTDYIAIAPDSFYTDLLPLLEMHQKRGLKTAFVSIEQIYNRFSWGIKDPEAIRTFLSFCFHQNPANPPRYLLLAGDTSHDLDKKNRTLNIIPTHLSRIPGWGPGADDGYFSTVHGNDNFPDLAVGRFPARNKIDLRIMVNKTINYTTKTQCGFWKDNLLLLGGGEQEFTTFNDNITRSIIGPQINTIRMDADPDSRYYNDASIASQLIADQINSGIYILNFNGHGGGNIWSDNNFFGYKDLSRLYNGSNSHGGRLPVVFSFTCLTGFFESTNYRSLGEEFLRNSINGAVCFYGASSYTSRNGNVIMNNLMLESALHDTFASIGELINTCELNMLVLYGSQFANLVWQYNLLGDPALPFKMTPSVMDLSLIKSDLSGNENFTVNGSCSPIQKGSLHMIVKAGEQEWNRVTKTISSNTFTQTFPIKPGARTASGIVRAYAWNDSNEIRGWVKFAKDTIVVYDIQLSPSLPEYGDSISVLCRLTPDSSAQVYCLYDQTYSSSIPNFKGITMLPAGNGMWKTSQNIPILYNDNTDGKLVIQFRISAANGTRESEQFIYSIGPRADLAFTTKSMRMVWDRDSLRSSVQVLNAGNKSTSSFTLLLVWGDASLSLPDTIGIYYHTQPVEPGGIVQHTFTFPDTQGKLAYTSYLVNSSPEITTQNNSIRGSSYITKKILQTSSDTLHSRYKGVSIRPLSTLPLPHTSFLFTDTISDNAPLQSNSSWAPLNGDSIVTVSIGCRPPLGRQDSLMYIFHAFTNSSRSSNLSVMYYDTLLSHWIFVSGKNSPESDSIVNITNSTGPFAAAYLNDSKAPDIQVSVHGRTLDFVDYAAKDKPFSIFISDPSEIVPTSVSLLLNNRLFPSENHSSIPFGGDLKNISITAYPPVHTSLDSLTVLAMDFAGNSTSRTFQYLPGKDLSIQYLACHPNPFTSTVRPDGTMTKIRFAYSITDVAQFINLTIYTVSGRSIRYWNLNNLIGYQEIEWDGRDHEGCRIANGLYYAKLTVKNRSKKVKKIVKIAKLEGY